MNRVFYILISCLILGSCQESNKNPDQQSEFPLVLVPLENDAEKKAEVQWVGSTFMIGSGLGGSTFTLNQNGTFDQFGWCDICPGGRSFGNYHIKEDTLIKADTLCYGTHPHFANPIDTIPCETLGIDTLFMWNIENVIGFAEYPQPDSVGLLENIFWRLLIE